jgi:putative transposase
MPRAKRIYLPNHAWHLTHRCHNKAFLLRSAHDRNFWMAKLKEAVNKFGLCVLNYMTTMNHVHLIVFDRDTSRKTMTVARSMHLAAGQTAEQYNYRKARSGSFWGDRYHGTAVDSDNYLHNCLTYIDLNMVRAGWTAEAHTWPWCGLYELHQKRRTRGIIDIDELCGLTGCSSVEEHIAMRMGAVADAIAHKRLQREAFWMESVAVGSKQFVEATQQTLRFRCPGRRIEKMAAGNDADGRSCPYVLREPRAPYEGHPFVRPEETDNLYPWKLDQQWGG